MYVCYGVQMLWLEQAGCACSHSSFDGAVVVRMQAATAFTPQTCPISGWHTSQEFVAENYKAFFYLIRVLGLGSTPAACCNAAQVLDHRGRCCFSCSVVKTLDRHALQAVLTNFAALVVCDTRSCCTCRLLSNATHA